MQIFSRVYDNKKRRAVAYWFLTGVFMIIIQVLLGGVTRLTGTGPVSYTHLDVYKRQVETHRKNMLRKTNNKTVVGLIRYAMERQLI